jgi:hypothetical protein
MTGTHYSGPGWVKRACTRATGRATTGAGSRLCGSMLTGSLRCSSGRGETITSRCANPSLSHLGEGMFRITFVLSFTFSLTNGCIILRDGQYGLYFDKSPLDGSSAPYTTFGNDPLCSSGPKKSRPQSPGAVQLRSVMDKLRLRSKDERSSSSRPFWNLGWCRYCTSSSYECSIFLNT